VLLVLVAGLAVVIASIAGRGDNNHSVVANGGTTAPPAKTPANSAQQSDGELNLGISLPKATYAPAERTTITLTATNLQRTRASTQRTLRVCIWPAHSTRTTPLSCPVDAVVVLPLPAGQTGSYSGTMVAPLTAGRYTLLGQTADGAVKGPAVHFVVSAWTPAVPGEPGSDAAPCTTSDVAPSVQSSGQPGGKIRVFVSLTPVHDCHLTGTATLAVAAPNGKSASAPFDQVLHPGTQVTFSSSLAGCIPGQAVGSSIAALPLRLTIGAVDVTVHLAGPQCANSQPGLEIWPLAVQ
jgi:hypothetical protein